MSTSGGRPQPVSMQYDPDIHAPANWPPGVQYLVDQVYSAAVTADMRSALGRGSTGSESLEKIPKSMLATPCRWLRIDEIIDTRHPACGQRGLFAAHPLPPSSFICLYVGQVHTDAAADTDPGSNYDLSFDREAGLSIDATRCGNEARMTNDYRGIAERPNAEFRDCLVQVACSRRSSGLKWERRVGIFVLPAGKAGKRKVGIRAGEEILVSYGKAYWESRKASVTSTDDALAGVVLDGGRDVGSP